MNAYITKGCMTSHGGIVVEVDDTFIIEGKGVHLEGMKHFCPKCKMVVTAISLGSSFVVVGTKTIIMANDLTSCGAKFLPQQQLAVRDAGSGSGKGNAASSSFMDKVAKVFDEQIVALDETGNFMPDIAYYIKTGDGQIHKGQTDHEGKTPRIITNSADDLQVWLGDDAEAMIDMEQNNG